MKYSYLTLFAAIILAGSGALVSVLGLGALFAGAGTFVMVMIGGLEFGKVVLAGALHRYWFGISWLLKLPLAMLVVIMMGLTSLGIYGFLSDGYQKVASQYEVQVGQTEILADKGAIFTNRINSNNEVIKNKSKRAETLSALRTQQEVRLDSLYAKNYISNANKVRDDIDAATEEIRKLNDDINIIVVSNSVLADSVNVYNKQINEVEETSTITAELGPLIYLSNLSGLDMDTVVNYLIFLIIGVFDPAAVGLLILASSITKIEEDKRTGEPTLEPKPKKRWFNGLKDKLSNITIPKINKAPVKSVIDPETGVIDLSDAKPLNNSKDVWMGTYPDDTEPFEEGKPKSTVDIVLEKERAKKVGKRNFSVEIPDPKPTKALESTLLGKTWSKKE